MLCKRMALALLLPLSLAVLAGMGCGGNENIDPPPTPPRLSSDAGIADLSITLGELAPAFNPNIKNYAATVGYLGETSIGVTVTLRDTKARLTLNGLACASGVPTNVTLREGDNRIMAMVVAEDGMTDNTVTLRVNRLTSNTRVWVLNGVSGGPVANTKLTLTDTEGRVLADNVVLPREKNGQVIFGLDPNRKYNIYARGDNAAAACLANFDRAKEDTATLYCLRTSTTYYELEAPIIEEIAFATTNAANALWKTMANNAYYVGTAANMAAVRVTTLTRNLSPVDYAEYLPISLSIDELASENIPGAMCVTGDAIETNVPVNRGGKAYYMTTHRFTTPLINTDIFNKEHFLDIVVYDFIGNRTEQRVYLTITDSANQQLGDADLTNVTPTLTFSQGQTLMGAGDLARMPDHVVNAVDPVDPYPSYQKNIIDFIVRAPGSATNLGIRGFEVWRSNGNDSNFVKIATRHYATPTTGFPFTFEDRTPTLAEGNVYYRVRVFNGNQANNGYSPYSETYRGLVLPPTSTGQAASHLGVQNKLWPEFRLAASNPKMFKKETTDMFFFTLFVRSAINPYPFLEVPFRVNFEKTETILNTSGKDDNQKRYGFPAGKPTVEFMQVTGYSASSSTSPQSTFTGTWNYAYDSKEVDDVDDEGNPVKKTVYTPFAYLADDGSVAVNTDSAKFLTAMQNRIRAAYELYVDPPYFVPGVTYLWNIFGEQGGVVWDSNGPAKWTGFSAVNNAYFVKGANAYPENRDYVLGASYSSNVAWGLGSAEGWFTLVVDPGAK